MGSKTWNGLIKPCSKKGWKLLSQPDSLVARFIKSRYFPYSDFLTTVVGSKPSFAWKSIIFGRDLLQKGLSWKIGDRRNTYVWLEKWVHDPILGMRAPWVKNNTFDVNLGANALIDASTRRWNLELLREVFVPEDVNLIWKHQPVIARPDGFLWKHNRSGNFSVKSAYALAQELKIRKDFPEVLMQPSFNSVKEKVWKVSTAPKIRTFIWKALSDALPVVDLISKRGMKCDDRCQLCGLEGESIQHVLFECDPARQAWALSGIPMPELGFQNGSLVSNINYLLNLKSLRGEEGEAKRTWPWVIWLIWKSRNDFLFNGRRWDPVDIQEKAKADAEEWFLAQVVDEEIAKELKTVEKQRNTQMETTD